jgi:hypothetical protein
VESSSISNQTKPALAKSEQEFARPSFVWLEMLLDFDSALRTLIWDNLMKENISHPYTLLYQLENSVTFTSAALPSC